MSEPVDSPPIVAVFNDLRGKVLGCAAERRCGGPECNLLLAQPKVSDLDVALLVQQQVLELQVTVDDT